jgi:RNA polymerase sigma-70 factor (ECF subfamily)
VSTEHAERFTHLRPLLFTISYEILGSATESDDVLQDSYLRWAQVDLATVRDTKSYLALVVTRQALKALRSGARRREDYIGPWLPEPLLLDERDASTDVVLAESVSMAMLVLLETLTPDERAVFVLREVFGMPWTEVAAVVDRSEPAVRQLGHRAREHVQARRPRFETDRRSTQEVTERFLAACVGGDIDALMAVLSPGVVLMTDGGGRVKAALRPIVGADKVARFLVAVTPDGLATPGLRVAMADVNGSPGVVVWSDAGPLMAVSAVVADGVVVEALVMMNPDKLRGLTAAPGRDAT